MHKMGLAILAATGIAAATIGFAAPATAAPSGGSSSVQDTVNSLQDQGYHVVLNKTGAAPLSQCTVTAIRPGQDFTPFSTRNNNGVVQHTFSTVYVDVGC
jgi:hypothetical protein